MTDRTKRIEIIKRLHELQKNTLYGVKDEKVEKLTDLAEGLISPCQVHAFFGEGETYKSTLLLEVAVCMCAGVDTFFGKTEQCIILWIDEEMGYDGLMDKIDLIAKDLGLKDNEWKKNFHYWTMSDFKVDSIEAYAIVLNKIAQDEIDAVFVDSLTACTKTDGGEETTRKLRDFNKLAYKSGVAMSYIHHTPKSKVNKTVIGMDALRGSIDFANQVDNGYAITKVSGHYRLRQAKGRHKRRSELTDINFDVKEKSDSIGVINLGNTSDYVKSNKTKKFMIMDKIMNDYNAEEIIQRHNLLKKYKDIASRDTIDKAIKELNDTDFIKSRDAEGEYKRSNKIWLTE